jgi:hypothetical protein
MACPLRFLLPVLLLAGCAQARPQTLTAEWDIRAVLKEIAAHAGRLVPVLDKADPAGWAEKGAPEAYVAQWKSARAQAQALAGDATELAQDPEKLPAALKTFFRMQSLEFMLGSLGEGIRRYQGPAVADALAGVAAENGANRERFQRYIVELAAQREQEYQIMDHEAQRCRGTISREAPARKAARKQPQ